MFHVGRPGEDGYTERVLASWGVDGHNSHTNVCSSGGRTGYQFWMGADRPSPDHANAKVIYLISSHLETGHYFNPHAQRITEARANGAKLIVLDTRLSNTATHADFWLSPQPGSEAAINLAVAQHIITTGRYDREFVRRWWNWEEYLEACHPELPVDLRSRSRRSSPGSTPSSPSSTPPQESGRRRGDAGRGGRGGGRRPGTRFSSHNWRSAAAANLGGWQITRTLVLISALLGLDRHRGGLVPELLEQVRAGADPHAAPPRACGTSSPGRWSIPLAQNELSFLLPQFLKEGRGRLDTYFIRVYNPVWTNPDGLSWMEVLTDEDKVGCFIALTPTWNESAYLADLVLPMGHGSERHDTHSYEQYDGQWLGFRQPVLRAARERLGETVTDTREVNPGEVWEENEFWIELSWRIDPDGSLGIRQYHESRAHPGEKLTVDEYYGWMFENSVPGLPERRREEGLTPLDFMRRYGAFEISKRTRAPSTRTRSRPRSSWTTSCRRTAASTPPPRSPRTRTGPRSRRPHPTTEGRRPVGRAGRRRGPAAASPHPSGRLEFWSSTLAGWGWPEQAIPGYIKSHVHPDALAEDQMLLLSTFRLPTQIHTRSANSKWLDELAHTNPLWIHPSDAARLGVASTGDLVRVETDIGHFVAQGVGHRGHPARRGRLHPPHGSLAARAAAGRCRAA